MNRLPCFASVWLALLAVDVLTTLRDIMMRYCTRPRDFDTTTGEPTFVALRREILGLST